MNYVDQIQEYIDGLLSDEARLQFEQAMQADEELANEVKLQKMLNRTIENHESSFADQVALSVALHAARRRYESTESTESKKAKKTPVIRWLAPVAAAACLLIAVNYFQWFRSDSDYFPKMAHETTRGVNTGQAYADAVTAFNAEQYDKSTQLLLQIVETDSTTARYRYYLGLSYLGAKQYAESVAVLKPIADGPSVFADDANYFLAEGYQQLGENELAAQHAGKVSAESSYYKRAQKLKGK